MTLERCARARRRAGAAADPPPQVRRAGRGRRGRAASPRRRARSSSTRRRSSSTATRRCRSSWSRRSARVAAGPGRALSADPDLRQAHAVLPEPAPRRCRACASARPTRRWSCTRTRPPRAASPPATGWRSRRRRAACAAGPLQRKPGSARGVGQHGWWQACGSSDAPGYDPFGADGANFNLLISGDDRRPGQRHGIAALVSLRDHTEPLRSRHACGH